MGKKFDISAAATVDLNKRKSAHIKDMLDTSTRTVQMIPLSQIDDFPDHPFYVKDDEDMTALVESIKENGVLTPINVIEHENGRYISTSGHRRRRACKIAGLELIPAIIENMTFEEATVAMVDANLQREKILPSERAFAYKMKMDALKKQGKRTDLATSSQVGTKLRSDEQIAKDVGESRNQIHRYIRLTFLIPELLRMVDDGILPFTVAVDLSYLDTAEQYGVLQYSQVKKLPNNLQAAELKQLSKAGIVVNADTIERTINPPKEVSDICAESEDDRYEQLTIDGEADLPSDPSTIEPPKSQDVLQALKSKFKPQAQEIPNWDGTDNQVMKGYILKARDLWNKDNYTDPIPDDAVENLLMALKWATEDLTASEAFSYYMTH